MSKDNSELVSHDRDFSDISRCPDISESSIPPLSKLDLMGSLARSARLIQLKKDEPVSFLSGMVKYFNRVFLSDEKKAALLQKQNDEIDYIRKEIQRFDIQYPGWNSYRIDDPLTKFMEGNLTFFPDVELVDRTPANLGTKGVTDAICDANKRSSELGVRESQLRSRPTQVREVDFYDDIVERATASLGDKRIVAVIRDANKESGSYIGTVAVKNEKFAVIDIGKNNLIVVPNDVVDAKLEMGTKVKLKFDGGVAKDVSKAQGQNREQGLGY